MKQLFPRRPIQKIYICDHGLVNGENGAQGGLIALVNKLINIT